MSALSQSIPDAYKAFSSRGVLQVNDSCANHPMLPAMQEKTFSKFYQMV